MLNKQSVNSDSLRKRYFYKLFTNLIGIPIGLLTQLIIPRGLGPKNYGDFNFLSNFFAQFVGFFDTGTSLAFYTKLSQRPDRKKLVSFYFYFTGIVGLLVLAFVIASHITGGYKKIWPDEWPLYIYMAAFFGIVVWISQIMNSMIDAYGLTVSAEVGKFIQKILGLVLIGGLFIFHKISLFSVFLYNYAILFILILAFIWIVKKGEYFSFNDWKLNHAEIKKYTHEFYQYSHPLFIFSLVGVVVGIFDRWLLQLFGGSIKQGFFGLAYQVGTICFLFASAMTPLISREYSIAYAKNDMKTIARLFRRHIPLLYSITAFASCFMAVNADKVTLIVGGGKFREATLAVCIMAFYPIHQVYGNLSAAVFYSTGQTKLYRNIGVFFMILGLPVTYFLIAPRQNMGLDAGAVGLAIKMVVIQFIGVNVQLYYNARFLQLSFWKYVAHQIFVVIFLVISAACVSFGVDKIAHGHINIVVNFSISALLYILMVGGFVYWKPVIFGVQRGDIIDMVNLLLCKSHSVGKCPA